MYISEITIEGFKSYANRVTLSNFDQCFNAITGLNGTGKSNILDSICFVLGLKNLTQVCCAEGSPAVGQNPWHCDSCVGTILEGAAPWVPGSAPYTAAAPMHWVAVLYASGTRDQPSGLGLQAGTSRHHKSDSEHHIPQR